MGMFGRFLFEIMKMLLRNLNSLLSLIWRKERLKPLPDVLDLDNVFEGANPTSYGINGSAPSSLGFNNNKEKSE